VRHVFDGALRIMQTYVLKSVLVAFALGGSMAAEVAQPPLTLFSAYSDDPGNIDPTSIVCIEDSYGKTMQLDAGSRFALLLVPVSAFLDAREGGPSPDPIFALIAEEYANRYTVVVYDRYTIFGPPSVRKHLMRTLGAEPSNIVRELGLDRYRTRVAFECPSSNLERKRKRLHVVPGLYLLEGAKVRYRYLIPGPFDLPGYLDAVRANVADFLSGSDRRRELHPLPVQTQKGIDLDETVQGLPPGRIALFRVLAGAAKVSGLPRVVRPPAGGVVLDPDGPAERISYYMQVLGPLLADAGFRLVGLLAPGSPRDPVKRLEQNYPDWIFLTAPEPGTQLHEVESLLLLDREHRIVGSKTLVLFDPGEFPVGMGVGSFIKKLHEEFP